MTDYEYYEKTQKLDFLGKTSNFYYFYYKLDLSQNNFN